jgi:glutamyl-tRNA synthetase
MVRVRFAPSPTGSLHLGSALTAVANRRFADEHGGELLLRIDDTDVARGQAGAEEGILRDLEWLGIGFEEGPYRQSERMDLYRAAAERLLESGHAYEDGGSIRFREERRPTIIRADGSATYHLASVVDDVELRITHVIRGNDHLPNTELHRALARALGAEPPEFIHHGLILGPDGAKLSKRHGAASLAELRERGFPPEAVRAYLEELDLPRHDVRFDPGRLERLSVDAIAALPDEELCARVEVPLELAPALRGARTLAEARAWARQIVDEPPPPELDERGYLTAERFAELRAGAGTIGAEEARSLVREVKAVGGDLRSLRRVLTGAERGPELWAVLVALPREQALARAAAAVRARAGRVPDLPDARAGKLDSR